MADITVTGETIRQRAERGVITNAPTETAWVLVQEANGSGSVATSKAQLLTPIDEKTDEILSSDTLTILSGEGNDKSARKIKPERILAKKLDPMSLIMMSLSGIIFVSEVEKIVFEELEIEK